MRRRKEVHEREDVNETEEVHENVGILSVSVLLYYGEQKSYTWKEGC